MWGNENNKKRYSACDLWNTESRNKQHAIMVRFGHLMKEESFFSTSFSPSCVWCSYWIGLCSVALHHKFLTHLEFSAELFWTFLQQFLNSTAFHISFGKPSNSKGSATWKLRVFSFLSLFQLQKWNLTFFLLNCQDHTLSSCTSQFWIYYILNQRGVQFLKFTADWVMYQRRPRHSAWF